MLYKMVEMVRSGWFIVLFFIFATTAKAQRSFITEIGKTTRSYYLTFSKLSSTQNQPLVIILQGVKGLTSSEIKLNDVVTPSLIVFPRSIDNKWHCDKSNTDIAFITKLINELYKEFQIDRTKIVIIGTNSALCLVNEVKTTTELKQISSIELKSEFSQAELVSTINGWFNSASFLSNKAVKPKMTHVDSILTGGFTSLDSLKRNSWHKRKTLSISRGGFYFLPEALTTTDYKTYVNVANSKNFTTLQYTNWGSDSLAYFLEIGYLGIPQNQDVNLAGGTASVTVGGGILTTFLAGFKYSFYRHKARPYFAFGAGPMSMVIFGGKFEASSNTSFSSADGGRPSSNNFKMAARINTLAIIESGMDLRLGKRTYVSFNVRYTHSGSFDKAGGINAVRAIGVNTSIGLILGANKESNLKK